MYDCCVQHVLLPHKFTGYERDPETAYGATDTGLDYAFARYYSSRLGRFVSTDPLGGAVGNLQSHNAYAYVVNNPLNLIDPSGMGQCPPQAPPGTVCGPPQSAGCYAQGFACPGGIGGLLGDFGTCTSDGAPILCSSAAMSLQAGAAVPCQGSSCNSTLRPTQGPNGTTVWQQLVWVPQQTWTTGDDVSGYVVHDAIAHWEWETIGFTSDSSSGWARSPPRVCRKGKTEAWLAIRTETHGPGYGEDS